MNLENLQDETFRPYLNQIFTITATAETQMDATLIAVKSSPHMGADRRQFSLLFLGPQAPVLGQATYQVENLALGKLEIFLCPVGVSGKGAEYEAVFT